MQSCARGIAEYRVRAAAVAAYSTYLPYVRTRAGSHPHPHMAAPVDGAPRNDTVLRDEDVEGGASSAGTLKRRGTRLSARPARRYRLDAPTSGASPVVGDHEEHRAHSTASDAEALHASWAADGMADCGPCEGGIASPRVSACSVEGSTPATRSEASHGTPDAATTEDEPGPGSSARELATAEAGVADAEGEAAVHDAALTLASLFRVFSNEQLAPAPLIPSGRGRGLLPPPVVLNGRKVRQCPACGKYIAYKNYSHHWRDIHEDSASASRRPPT